MTAVKHPQTHPDAFRENHRGLPTEDGDDEQTLGANRAIAPIASSGARYGGAYARDVASSSTQTSSRRCAACFDTRWGALMLASVVDGAITGGGSFVGSLGGRSGGGRPSSGCSNGGGSRRRERFDSLREGCGNGQGRVGREGPPDCRVQGAKARS